MEEISKKDLLILTGISYGQLYRWKRKGLIPEEWFIKRASFTGQETYFPKDLILERIDRILELKDEISLEELSKIINSKNTRKITINELRLANIFSNQEIFELINSEIVSFNEIIMFKIIDNIYDKINDNNLLNDFVSFLKININEIVNNYKLMYINLLNDSISAIFIKENNTLTYNINDYIVINLKNLIENIKMIMMI